MHQGHDLLTVTHLTAHGQARGAVQLLVQPALHPRYVLHCHPHCAGPAHLQLLAIPSAIWPDAYSLLELTAVPEQDVYGPIYSLYLPSICEPN